MIGKVKENSFEVHSLFFVVCDVDSSVIEETGCLLDGRSLIPGRGSTIFIFTTPSRRTLRSSEHWGLFSCGKVTET
jgi:hypothetical protein